MKPIAVLLAEIEPAAVRWDSAGLHLSTNGSRIQRTIIEELRARRCDIIDHLERESRKRARLLVEERERDAAAWHAVIAREWTSIKARRRDYLRWPDQPRRWPSLRRERAA